MYIGFQGDLTDVCPLTKTLNGTPDVAVVNTIGAHRHIPYHASVRHRENNSFYCLEMEFRSFQ